MRLILTMTPVEIAFSSDTDTACGTNLAVSASITGQARLPRKRTPFRHSTEREQDCSSDILI
jgi:hypothetical protein